MENEYKRIISPSILRKPANFGAVLGLVEMSGFGACGLWLISKGEIELGVECLGVTLAATWAAFVLNDVAHITKVCSKDDDYDLQFQRPTTIELSKRAVQSIFGRVTHG